MTWKFKGGRRKKVYRRLNCGLIFIALIVIAVLSPALFLSKVQAPSEQPWWNTNWQYRKSIQIDNTLNPKTLTDYPVSITFDAASLVSAGKMKSDLSDLRFFDPDSSTVLNYWIESMPTPSQPASPDVMNWKYPSNPLSIPIYDYLDVVHPKVLYFPSGYGGYKFWMFYEQVSAETEVISLVRSNDGINWTDAGVTNPILPNGPSGSFDSWACADPDVVIVGGTWYLFFDGSNTSADRIGLATSTDGLHWAKVDLNGDGVEDPVLFSDANYVAPDGHKYESADLFLSPTAYHDGTRFWLWLGSGEGTRADSIIRTMLFSCVDPTASWTRENNAEPVLSPTDWEGDGIWHIEVTKHGNEFWMYYCAARGGGSIGFAKSTDKLTWTKSARNPILTTESGTWEDGALYRSSCIEVGSEIWLYYSAYDSSRVGRIGLAKALPSAGDPNAVVQVETPSILAGSKKTIYMYYGNPSATAISNGDNTFTFFDDFNDNSLNSTKWQTGSGRTNEGTPIGSISETNQHLEISEKTSIGPDWVDLYTVTKTSWDFSNGMSFKVSLENPGPEPRAAIIDLIPASTTNSFLYPDQPQWLRFMVYQEYYYLQIKYSDGTSPVTVKSAPARSATRDLNAVAEIQINDTRLRCLLNGVVWVDWYTHNVAWHSAYVYLEQSTRSTSSSTTVHDNIVIRKFTQPDPTTSAGSEESQSAYTLTVSTVGSGSVSLNNTGPYHYGDVVRLTAAPSAGWSFSAWSGNLTGSVSPADLTITGNMSVTATFTMNVYTPFSIISNSTITELAFNSTSQVLSFTASGPSGSTGFANVTISKTLMSDISALQVYLDGAKIGYSVDNLSDSWLIYFTYSHSTHKIVVDFSSHQGSLYPIFGGISANTTVAGSPVQLSCPVSSGTGVSSYIYSWNKTGTWINQTATRFSSFINGTAAFATFYGVWNRVAGNTISVIIYANDTSNNWAASNQYNFVMVAGVASRLVFTVGAGQTVRAGKVSSVITVQRQDQYGNPVTSGSTTVGLSSSSRGATFYSDAGFTQGLSVSINEGSSTVSFWYKDARVGSPTLTASAYGLISAITNFRIRR